MADRRTKDPERAVREVIAGMTDDDRRIAEPLDALIRTNAPELSPRLWYGQPAYARKGKVVVFFRGADVDKEPYVTLGFTAEAQLDDGDMWPVAYALTGVTAEQEKRIAALVKRAAG